MSTKPANLVIASALLSAAIVFHAWYPVHYGPDAARMDWIRKCVAIEGYGQSDSIRLSDIPDQEPLDLLTEDEEEQERNRAVIADRKDRESQFKLEQNCMATYAIATRGGR